MSIKAVNCHVCDFCAKTEHQVRKIVAGPGADICDECVALAAQIVAEETQPEWKLPEGVDFSTEVRYILKDDDRDRVGQAGSVDWREVKTWERV